MGALMIWATKALQMRLVALLRHLVRLLRYTVTSSLGFKVCNVTAACSLWELLVLREYFRES